MTNYKQNYLFYLYYAPHFFDLFNTMNISNHERYTYLCHIKSNYITHNDLKLIEKIFNVKLYDAYHQENGFNIIHQKTWKNNDLL